MNLLSKFNLRIMTTLLLGAGLGLTLGVSPVANAITLSGTVQDDKGELLEGAIIKLHDKNINKTHSVYSNENGHYSLDYDTTGKEGNIEVGVRYFTYVTQSQAINNLGQDQNIDFQLQPATNDQIRQQLPSHVWVERIAKISKEVDHEFRIECMMCHQQGHNLGRWPQTRDDWHVVFNRMAHKNAMVTSETKEKTITALLEAFKVKNDQDLPRIPDMPKGEETQVEITEWRAPVGTFMHDIAVGPDGKIYGASGMDNEIWRLDPSNDQLEALSHVKPEPNMFVGEKLGLHTVLASPDKKSMWFTYASGNIVSRYDIPSETMKTWNLSYAEGLYPHTLRFDTEGQIWFTVTATNQLGTINPETDELEYIELPTRTWMQSLFAWPPLSSLLGLAQQKMIIPFSFPRELRPVAYGIAATPDGKIWFSQYATRRIGSYDKKTKEIKMIDTPFGGPRRFRSDSKGNLWIPSFTDGRIYKYQPSIDKFTGYDLPTGRSDSVYAVAVDPSDDTIWGCGSNSDTMLHFYPKTEKYVTYQFPSLVTFCREISFDAQGNVWTSYSNAPIASVEGGTTAFVRVSKK